MSGASWTPVRAGGGAPAGAPGGPPGAGPAIAKPGVGGWAQKNKVVIGAGAVGVVVVLALLNRSKGSDDSTATGTTVSGTTAGQNTAAYDSSAADTYNALQPEIENLRNLIENWQSTVVPVPTTPVDTTPVTTPVATTPTPTTVPVSTVTAEQAANIALSPVGTALANKGILPPADSGASNSKAQADYGKSYEAQWEAMYGLKK